MDSADYENESRKLGGEGGESPGNWVVGDGCDLNMVHICVSTYIPYTSKIFLKMRWETVGEPAV